MNVFDLIDVPILKAAETDKTTLQPPRRFPAPETIFVRWRPATSEPAIDTEVLVASTAKS
jgi:hypothetical protein